MSNSKKLNLRSRDRLHSVELRTPPSSAPLSKQVQSPDYLDRLDTIVQEAVTKAMERERLKLCSDMQKLENNVREILDQKLSYLHDLEVAIDSKLQKLNDVERSVSANSTEVNNLTNRLDHLEQYSRRNNIRILGVKTTPGENTDDIVRDVAHRIGITISAGDIDRSHRLHRPGNTPERSQGSYANATRTGNTAPPPIIVKFTSYQPKFQMIKNRRKLKGSGIVVVEDLTRKNANLLFQTSRKANVKASWSLDGRVYALVKTTEGHEMRRHITKISDL